MTRRVIAITGAGGALGAALSAHFAGAPDTDLVLSDVSAPSLDATVSGLPEGASPRSKPSSPEPWSASVAWTC